MNPVFYNSDARPFLVRVVRKGDAYGLDDCLTHDSDDPMVEFYDKTLGPPKFSERGQYVSRYFASTLLTDTHSLASRGLDLVTYEPAWKVDGCVMEQVFRYMKAEGIEAS